MKATEVKLERQEFRFNTKIFPARSHYKDLMETGKCFPNTKAQAKFFVSNGVVLNVLNKDDVEFVESFLNKHGFKGNYKYTKGKNWVRLVNNDDLHKSLKLEFVL